MFVATLVRDIYIPNFSSSLRLPLYLCPVSAGFPSPAEDYIEGRLDLNRYLVKHPAATFFVRVTGDSMIDAGIHPGDLLIVDRAIAPTNGKIVIAVLNGELTVKRVRQSKQKLFLMPENPQYPSLEIRSEMDFQIWGVVTNVIHPL
ncbi:translesion error-prone DNA polymerase V autoproteolytic subunit [Tumidithrix helvetica PCC 7403]|uniref:LexA family protein n=1 Tax=Tumidithrix helvetica TaxID=3457545 RepID=UPI003C9989F7